MGISDIWNNMVNFIHDFNYLEFGYLEFSLIWNILAGTNAFLVRGIGCTQWCKFMSKNLNFAGEISRGGRGRTRVGGATKMREISRTSWLRNLHHWVVSWAARRRNLTYPKVNETQGFLTLGHSNCTICRLLSWFCSKKCPPFYLS